MPIAFLIQPPVQFTLSPTTGCTCYSEASGIAILKQFDWSLESALDAYFQSGLSASSPGADASKVDALFENYKEPDGSDTIQVTGVERFCQDLQVDPSDPLMLMISWKMEAATMCTYTREEWQRGFMSLRVDSIDGLRGTFDQLREQLRDDSAFRDYYVFCFNFAKEPGFGVRSLRTPALSRTL